MIHEFRHDVLTTFHGLPVFHFGFADADDLAAGNVPDDVEAWAWRVGNTEYEGPAGDDIYALFVDTVDTTRIKALILGAWDGEIAGESAADSQQALLNTTDRFPALEALFISDMSSEQTEVSWIEQADFGPLAAAFPDLRVLGVRGSGPLEPFTHESLEELAIQTGGLPPATVRALGQCTLPSLTILDLYLGTDEYSGGATADDLDAILSGAAFPALRHLGLRDAANADEIAAAIAHAPIVAQLESLDLSLGALGDEGAAALLSGQPLTHLKKLDLHHHFMSEAMIKRLWQALPDVELNVDEKLEPEAPWREDMEPFRYIAVAE